MLLPSTTAIAAFLALAHCSSLCAAQQVPFHHPLAHIPVLDDEFANWLRETGDIWGMKGVSVAVTRWDAQNAEWITETKGYGVADRWGNPVTGETLFSIGSNSKLFTALGMGLLATNDSIPMKWDTKIKDILPGSLWQLKDHMAQNYADIVDILGHRIGLPRHDMSYSLTDTTESVVYKLRYLQPSAEFRQVWQYNNQMYLLAAHIIEHLNGRAFSEFMTQNIIIPLGLTSTTYNVTLAHQSGKLAESFLSSGKDREKGEGRRKLLYKPIPFWAGELESKLMAGAGGIISNANDMAVWLQSLLLLGKNPTNNNTVIPSSVFEKIGRGVSVTGPASPPMVYGLGQTRYAYEGHEFYEHHGGTIGHYSIVTRSPQDKLGIAVLVNSDDIGPLMEMVKCKLIEKSLGLNESNWKERFPFPEEELKHSIPTDIIPPSHTAGQKSSTMPLTDFSGIYFNPAYGTLVICPYESFYTSSTQPSKECNQTIVETTLPVSNGTKPSLFAVWPKVWSTHVLFHHVSESRFEVSLMHSFPAPFPDGPPTEDNRPFAVETWGRAVGEFISEKPVGNDAERVQGVALNGLWGQGPDVDRPEQKGKEGAEVWFDKVA